MGAGRDFGACGDLDSGLMVRGGLPCAQWPDSTPRPGIQCTLSPQDGAIEDELSELRSRSAFTFRSSRRSILAWSVTR